MKNLIIKVIRWFLSIGTDKWLHLLFGLVIAEFAMLIPLPIGSRCIVAVSIVSIVELFKENFIDSQIDWLDVLYTEIGCGIGIGLSLLTIICI